MARADIDTRKDEIHKLLLAGVPRMEICRLLHCKYDTLKARLVVWGFDGLKNPQRKGRAHPEGRVDALTYCEPNAAYIRSHALRVKLIRDGYKKAECETCHTVNWQGQPVPLELDHINGDHFDNTFSNLRILCPNCHAQTPTNSGKNVGNYRR